jgi:hypothetical protein
LIKKYRDKKMKGIGKALSRLPHTVTSQFNKGTITTDETFDPLAIKYADLDKQSLKIIEQASKFKDSLTGLISHSQIFAETMVLVGWI